MMDVAGKAGLKVLSSKMMVGRMRMVMVGTKADPTSIARRLLEREFLVAPRDARPRSRGSLRAA